MYLLGPALYKIGGYGYLIPQCKGPWAKWSKYKIPRELNNAPIPHGVGH